MHPEKAVPKMLPVPEYGRKKKEEQQALLLRANYKQPTQTRRF